MIVANVALVIPLKNATVLTVNLLARTMIATIKSRLEVLTDLLDFYNNRVQAGSTLTGGWASPDIWLRDIAHLREMLKEHCPGYIEEFDNDRKAKREYRAKLLEQFTIRYGTA